VLLRGDRGEGDFGEGLGNADNGLKLTDGDGNGRALAGLLLLEAHIRADRDKVVAELLGGLWREAGGTLGLAVGNVPLHRVDGDVSRGRLGRGRVHVNPQHVLGKSLQEKKKEKKESEEGCADQATNTRENSQYRFPHCVRP